MNYKKYNMTKQESLKYGAFYILTGLGISALFYRSFLGVILFLPFAGVFFREMKKILAEKETEADINLSPAVSRSVTGSYVSNIGETPKIR